MGRPSSSALEPKEAQDATTLVSLVSTHFDRHIHGRLRLHPGGANLHSRFSADGCRSRRGFAYTNPCSDQRPHRGSGPYPDIRAHSGSRTHAHPDSCSDAPADFNPHPRPGTNPYP